jgi:capsular polysaccharide biosynthesis protein
LEREITLRDYGRVLWSGRWIILGAAVVAGLIGLVLSYASSVTYTTKAKVFLGQATTASGVIAQTPLTSVLTAPEVLQGDDLVDGVAAKLGVSSGRIKRDVSLNVPRPPGNAGANQPSVLEITFQDRSRRVAVDGAQAYAAAVYNRLDGQYKQVQNVLLSRLRRAQQQVAIFTRQIQSYTSQIRSADATDKVILQSLLQQAQNLLTTAQASVDTNALLLAKGQEIEAPSIVSVSTTASSSGSAPNRARTVLFAAIIGLLVGIIVTFVWKGSPAGRAAPKP